MRKHSIQWTRREGAILPLLAILMVAIIGAVALAVDLGTLALAKNQLQNAADAAAFAGARALNTPSGNTKDVVHAAATNVLSKTLVLNKPVTASGGAGIQSEVGTYTYQATNGKFAATYGTNSSPAEPYGAVKADILISKPTSFARIFNASAFSVRATAQAVHRPRDIAMILDFSGSMRFDSLPTHPHVSYQPIEGSMNPDTRVPNFGYYKSGAIRGQILRSGGNVVITGSNEVLKPCNLTIGNPDTGTAIVDDFYTVPGGVGNIPAYIPGRGDIGLQTKAFRPRENDPYFNSFGDGDPWPKKKNDPTSNARTFAEVRGLDPANVTGSTRSSLEDGDVRTISPNGWTLGPGYYGKTFYIWPPDPNNDWRRKYFNKSDNASLFYSNGQFKPALNGNGNSNYRITYNNVIAWLKSGPQVFPDNLYAGRIVYYESIPDSIPNTGGTPDQRFWRAYIDYVLGAGCQDQVCYGKNTQPWGTIRVTPASQLDGVNGKPRPYMHYNDNVIHPLSNFWFGPLTMLSFLSDYKAGKNWLPGTAHEAPTWQLKAAVNSTLLEIEKNHPNDRVALILFSDTFEEVWSPMSESLAVKRDRLFYPKQVINQRLPFIRPFGSNFNESYLGVVKGPLLEDGEWDDNCLENVPNGQGRTNPEMGFMLASNQINTKATNKGRKGASKVFILETDGAPNRQAGNRTKDGSDLYTNVKNENLSTGSNEDAVNAALNTLTGIKNREKNVKVHSIGFGTLFELNTDPDGKAKARQFLKDSQNGIEPTIITGSAEQRKKRLLEKFQTILQGDVAITLID